MELNSQKLYLILFGHFELLFLNEEIGELLQPLFLIAGRGMRLTLATMTLSLQSKAFQIDEH